MKKLLTIALLLCATIAGYSQEYEPTEGWPYLFKDFKSAIVYYNDGKAESANVNVHLMKNDLHFTDQEKIAGCKSSRVSTKLHCPKYCFNNTYI
jgi:hypothetical protein